MKPAEKVEDKIGTTSEPAKKAKEPKAEEQAQEKVGSAEGKKDEGPVAEAVPAAEPEPPVVAVAETASEPVA